MVHSKHLWLPTEREDHWLEVPLGKAEAEFHTGAAYRKAVCLLFAADLGIFAGGRSIGVRR